MADLNREKTPEMQSLSTQDVLTAITTAIEAGEVISQASPAQLTEALTNGPPGSIGKKTKEELLRIISSTLFHPDCSVPFYDECKRIYDQEEDRAKVLDSKAGGLAALLGGSYAILFAMVGFLTRSDFNTQTDVLHNAKLGFVGCIGLLSFSAVCTLIAWRVANFQSPKEEAIFSEKALQDANHYRRYMGLCFTIVRRMNGKVNDAKAEWLQSAQNTYFVFILFLVCLGIYLVTNSGA